MERVRSVIWNFSVLTVIEILCAMRVACYFNRFKGFPLNAQAFLVHLRCDLSATSTTVATRTAAITAT